MHNQAAARLAALLFILALLFASASLAPQTAAVAGQPEVPQASAARQTAPEPSLEESQTVATTTRTIQVSPAAFLRDLTAPEIVMTSDIALRWTANNTEQAGFYLTRPPDWDQQSPVKVRIYFALGGSSAGSVNWRLKVNSYTPGSGEWLTNPGTRDADAILNFADGPSWYRVYSQTFTLQPGDFFDDPLWSFYFLRGSGANGETFAGDLYVIHAEVEYEAVPALTGLFLPFVKN